MRFNFRAMESVKSASGDVSRWLLGAMAIGHFAWAAATIGLRFEHFLIDALLLGAALFGDASRRLAFTLLPLWILCVVYTDVLPLVVPSSRPVHVADLYQAELDWFGVNDGTERVIVCELFRERHSSIADLIFGLVYLCYLPEMVPFVGWLLWRDRALLARLLWSILAVSVAGYVTWLEWPAAPPWYVEQYGLGPANLNALPSAAGAARLDDLLGIQIAARFYARNSNVFGAMPSIHVASATVYACVAASMGRRWFVGALVFALLMAAGAVYLRHHYIFDVLAGIVYGVTTYAVVTQIDFVLRRRPSPDHGLAS
jgi:membrane-associated phospholipid phosphatase